MAKLNEKAMLATLSISQWRAQKHDKNISEEIAQNHGTTPDVGRYNKFLVDRQEVKEIAQVANEARTYHYAHTLPWMDDGCRILTAAMFPEYAAKMQELSGHFRDSCEKFMQAYPSIVQGARMKLNGLFREADYPPLNRLSRKYGFEVKFMPMPDKEDFRVKLSEDERAEIMRNIEESANSAVKEAMKELYLRLHEVVLRMVERLSDSEAVFRDSLVENITRLCLILPKLNLTNDPKLEELRKEVEDKLTKFDPNTLRNDAEARKETAEQADEILKKLQEVIA